MAKFLAIYTDRKHININVFGFKFKLKLFFDKKMYQSFMDKKVADKTVLIVEFNDYHYETIPGLCKYCVDLGYNVDVLTRNPAEDVFKDFNLRNVRIFECNSNTFDKIYKNYDFSKYYRIIYNSKRLYLHNTDFDCSEIYKTIKCGQKSNIYLQHHIERCKESSEIQIVLANPAKNKALDSFVVNSHYFKSDVNIHKKNEIVNFISIGALTKDRRNSSLLIDAVKSLKENGYSNFKITIIGRGELENLPEQIRGNFNILGNVDYHTMFDEIEKSDFLLPLLDPDMKGHDRYKKEGTSGSFQLIYGFTKLCIIHKTFADIYDFSEKNAIIYNENQNFVNSMIKAIEMKQDDYESLQNCLKEKVKIIEEKSLENLRGVLNA